MITPNWVKELTKIDDEDLFIDERRLKKALKFYETKKNAPRFAEEIKSEVDEGFAEDPDEPIYHRFPRWFSESEEFSKSLVNICKSNVGSEDYMKIWYMMNTALTCLISGKVYSLNAMEGEYEDEAYQVFIALMKYIAKDYDNFSKKFGVTNNLSEANKFFFGTEDSAEVKKLFEGTVIKYELSPQLYEKIMKEFWTIKTKKVNKNRLVDLAIPATITGFRKNEKFVELPQFISELHYYYFNKVAKEPLELTDFEKFVGLHYVWQSETSFDFATFINTLRGYFGTDDKGKVDFCGGYMPESDTPIPFYAEDLFYNNFFSLIVKALMKRGILYYSTFDAGAKFDDKYLDTNNPVKNNGYVLYPVINSGFLTRYTQGDICKRLEVFVRY